jgi:hypothetical protein
MKEQLKAAALSYIRAALSCVGALYLSGVTEPKVLVNAFIAGLIGPLIKAVSPNEKQLGIGAKYANIIGTDDQEITRINHIFMRSETK